MPLKSRNTRLTPRARQTAPHSRARRRVPVRLTSPRRPRAPHWRAGSPEAGSDRFPGWVLRQGRRRRHGAPDGGGGVAEGLGLALEELDPDPGRDQAVEGILVPLELQERGDRGRRRKLEGDAGDLPLQRGEDDLELLQELGNALSRRCPGPVPARPRDLVGRTRYAAGSRGSSAGCGKTSSR
jgi:hypothetical protein